jgi:hypothetical protein
MPKETPISRFTREAGEHAAEQHPLDAHATREYGIISRLQTAYTWALYRATIERSDTVANAWHRAGVSWRWAHATIVYSTPHEWDDPENADLTDRRDWLDFLEGMAAEPGKSAPEKVIAGLVGQWLAE